MHETSGGAGGEVAAEDQRRRRPAHLVALGLLQPASGVPPATRQRPVDPSALGTELGGRYADDLRQEGDRGTPVRTSFVFGSQELYDWVDDNPRARMLRTETTNSPAAIAQQPAMTSINTALQVDLFDQANASRIGARIYSGFGGQTDFTVGASHSPGGRAFMALRSWHPRADVSTIVPLVDEPVTSFQHGAVVTEQGVRGCGAGASASRRTTSSSTPRTRACATTSGRRPGTWAWRDAQLQRARITSYGPAGPSSPSGTTLRMTIPTAAASCRSISQRHPGASS